MKAVKFTYTMEEVLKKVAKSNGISGQRFKYMTDYVKIFARAFRRIDKMWRKGKPRFSLYSSDKFVALTKRGNVVEAFSNINKDGYCYE